MSLSLSSSTVISLKGKENKVVMKEKGEKRDRGREREGGMEREGRNGEEGGKTEIWDEIA